MNLGEMYLRGKIDSHTPETFHRSDPRTNYAAIKDVLRLLDEARQEVEDIRYEILDLPRVLVMWG